MYCSLAFTVKGELKEKVWEELLSHQNETGRVLIKYEAESTVTTVPVKSEPTPVCPKVTWYWVFQFHVTVDGAVIVKVTDADEPEAGTLPVPVQPVQTY